MSGCCHKFCKGHSLCKPKFGGLKHGEKTKGGGYRPGNGSPNNPPADSQKSIHLYEIAALCDISRQLLEDIGKRYSIDRLYTTPHELVAQQDIDVVFVLNSDEYHA